MNDKTHTDIDGQNGYKDLIPLDVHMDSGMKYVYEAEQYESWQNPYRYNARYAVLIGGGSTDSSKNYASFKNDLKAMYDKLADDYNYLDANIYCFLWNKKKGDLGGRVDGPATWGGSSDTIRKAIQEIGNKITKNDLFYFTEICHGDTADGNAYFKVVDGKDLDEGKTAEYIIYTSDLNSYVNTYLEGRYRRSVFVFQSCNSGDAIPRLEGENRIIITAAKGDEDAYGEAGCDHWAFLYEGCRDYFVLPDIIFPGFIKSIGSLSSPHSVKHAFDLGYIAATNNVRVIRVYPSFWPWYDVIIHDWTSHPQIYNPALAKTTYL